MTETILEADAVGVTRGESKILHDVSLRVPADAKILVQGSSGAGKTTLFNLLGLLATPSQGTIRVNGTDAQQLSERRRAHLRREHIGFIFQDFQLIADLTAWENAALPQDHTGERDEEWLETLFESLELGGVKEQYPATLSGGEKQRVATARALANRPGVLLADEPTGQLDPKTTDQVLDLVLELRATTETALVTISHDPQLRSLFERVVRIEDGTVRTVE